MKEKKIRLTFFIIFIILASLQTWAQPNNNLNIVKKHYPHIYTSIKDEAEKQWTNDKNVRDAIMEGQANAFIQIAENLSSIDPIAMTDALLLGSLDGQKEYNRDIIDNLSIENPYPLLRCNWYKVKGYYDEKTTNRNNSVSTIQIPPAQKKDDNYRDEIYEQERKSAKKDKTHNSNLTAPEDLRFYNSGISINFIHSNISGLNDWDKNANPGKGLGFRIWGRQPFGRGFFGMSEAAVSFIHHSIDDNYNKMKGNLNQSYISLALMLGIYQQLSSNTALIIGGGGFSEMNFSTTSKYYRDEENVYPSSEDLNSFNYGFSGIIGIQYKRFEFAFRGDWGMADLSRDNFNFKSRTISLSIGYLFNCW